MPESKFGFVDHVVYINLDHRTDRRAEIEAELAPYFPAEKVTRFSAIHRENGALGASSSHIAVIEMAKAAGWKNVLVLEDDAMWRTDFEANYATLERLAGQPYDAIMISSTFTRWYLGSLKLITAKSAAAYIVNSHYYDTLLSNFKEGLELFEVSRNNSQHAVDTYWSTLQEKDNWFVVIPSLMEQRPGYSDIVKQFTDYR